MHLNSKLEIHGLNFILFSVLYLYEKNYELNFLRSWRKKKLHKKHLGSYFCINWFVNALIKKFLNKGVKVRQAPYKRFIYYLTPEGFSEVKLVLEYVTDSLSFSIAQKRVELNFSKINLSNIIFTV